MPALDEKDVIKINTYDSIKLDEYKGKYSLCAVDNGQNETFYLKWCFLSKWENGAAVPGDRKMPMKIVLGDNKEQAISTLEILLAELQGKSDSSEDQQDDTPF